MAAPSSGSAYDVDSPANMNAFLAIIGGTPVPAKRPAPAKRTRVEPVLHKGQLTPPASNDQDSGEVDLQTQVQYNQPSAMTPTSATRTEKALDLKANPIQDHEVPGIFAKLADPNSTLEDSKYCPHRLYNKTPSRYPVIPLGQRSVRTGVAGNKLDLPEQEFTRTTVQQEVLDKIEARNKAKADLMEKSNKKIAGSTLGNDTNVGMHSTAFEDAVLAKFKARAETNESGTKAMKERPVHFKEACEDINEYLTKQAATKTPDTKIKKGKSVNASNTEGNLSPVAKTFVSLAASDALTSTSTTDQDVTTTKVSASVKHFEIKLSEKEGPTVQANAIEKNVFAASADPGRAAIDSAKAKLANQIDNMEITIKEPGSPGAASEETVTSNKESVDRENATYFASWGAPQARSTPRAKVRKVVLRGLPAGADLTLVQSLIHGGAIDNYALGVNGIANVTFTTAEACDAYYAKYPNGIAFKHKGKNVIVFVEKTNDVNVVSGMLQGQLDCGATRCVRAVGADHGWGMAAFIKLAEGRTRRGKIEKIEDVWRNEIRTIIFRFTSIGDAVAFKASLIRHEDWEGCNIQFMDDPCEKATSVHIE